MRCRLSGSVDIPAPSGPGHVPDRTDTQLPPLIWLLSSNSSRHTRLSFGRRRGERGTCTVWVTDTVVNSVQAHIASGCWLCVQMAHVPVAPGVLPHSYLVAGVDVDASLQVLHDFVQVAGSGCTEEAGIAVRLWEKEETFREWLMR